MSPKTSAFLPPKSLACSAFVISCLLAGTHALRSEETPLTPFGSDVRLAPAPVKAALVKSFTIDCLGASSRSRWTIENPPDGQAANLFALEPYAGKSVLALSLRELAPAKTTVRILLPGDGPANGDVWAKYKASYVSFLCKSSGAARMTFHLLVRGKTAGTYQTGFAAAPGQWQQVILPIQQFGLKTFAKVAGLGFRVAPASAGKDITVRIVDISVGGMPFSDDSWKSHRLAISLLGGWRFATDPGDHGVKEKWYAAGFDDAAWKILRSGATWQEQGVSHHGFGWYRQKIVVPKEFAGTPLTLTLTKIASDDDVWFNGVRVGGWSGQYKYENQVLRVYTVSPSLIRYGEANAMAIRIWGGNLAFIGEKNGLTAGPLVAELDPYGMNMREPGGAEVAAELFDLSDAQRGKPFEIVLSFPPEVAKDAGATLSYRLADYQGNEIQSGKAALKPGSDHKLRAVVAVPPHAAQTIYLRGRLRISLILADKAGNPLYCGIRDLDRLSFAKRDKTPLPALPATVEETPYGTLRLVDEIDCSTPPSEELHAYLEGNFDHSQDRKTPGAAVEHKITTILGRKARESEFGWFAYRVGRGKLRPHGTYLLRIEYPEDMSRYCPVEIQVGQNYMDIGWKNGVGPDDVYDNWPLSKKWQWYDAVVPLDDMTVGAGGAESGSAANGFWVYFLNKLKPGAYFAMYSGGPAVARIKLYEIDPAKNAPVIRRPAGLPQRVLAFDWEHQPDHDPADLVRYAKLMGYSAISPVIIKWAAANYSEPLNGYSTVNIDDHGYWVTKPYDPKSGEKAGPPLPGQPSIHARYLTATRRYGVDYIPRFEWGGSMDLPQKAWAIGADGRQAKPGRYHTWCSNLLDPLTWDDLKTLMDHLIRPYVQENPQLTGALWRSRLDRLPISYGRGDIELFAKETGTKLPPGSDAQFAAWAAGEMKTRYDEWWHRKRAEFHAKLVALLRSYRPDLTLYYYNWDSDKWGLINPDINAAAFTMQAGKEGRAAYERDRAARKRFTAEDYIDVLRTGNFGEASRGVNRPDLGLRPALYKDIKGIQLFAPANYLCYADMPSYLNYFQTADGLAVSNAVSYDEIGMRSINPRYEGSMITPGGPAFSMALELLAYFHGDARTLNYTVYTYGRGFADAHRRFAQAFLALPAIPGTVVDQGDKDLKVRTYASANGTYLGVAYKGYAGKKFTVKVPGVKAGAKVLNLVTGVAAPAAIVGSELRLDMDSGPMELNAFVVQ